jgi:hypothetical protein
MTTQDPPPNGIDISQPNVARIYDYLLGGKDNFTVDREAAKRLLEASPDMAGIVRDNRSFIGRVVRCLAGEAGIRQFIDLGGGLPTQTILDMCTKSLANSGNYYNLLEMIANDGRIVPVLFGHYNVYSQRGLFDGLDPARDNCFFYSLGKTMSQIQIPTVYD